MNNIDFSRLEWIKNLCLIICAWQSGHCRLQSCQTSSGHCHKQTDFARNWTYQESPIFRNSGADPSQMEREESSLLRSCRWKRRPAADLRGSQKNAGKVVKKFFLRGQKVIVFCGSLILILLYGTCHPIIHVSSLQWGAISSRWQHWSLMKSQRTFDQEKVFQLTKII